MTKKRKPTLSRKLAQELVDAALKVRDAFHAYGPVDDGRPEGDEFDESLSVLIATARVAKRFLDGELD